MNCPCSPGTRVYDLPLIPGNVKKRLHLWGFYRKIHTLDEAENSMYFERKNEKAESKFVSAKKNMIPRSFHFPNLMLRALCVCFLILAPFNPILAYSRTPKRRAICLNNHLAANAHGFLQAFYFTSCHTPNKYFINSAELVQWGLTCFHARQFLDLCFKTLRLHSKKQLCHVPLAVLTHPTFFQVLRVKFVIKYNDFRN